MAVELLKIPVLLSKNSYYRRPAQPLVEIVCLSNSLSGHVSSAEACMLPLTASVE